MTDANRDVLGLGHAIVDVLGNVDDAFLEQHGLVKGAMTLIDATRAVELYREIENPVECSGGSAANTMVGIASLGGECTYIGKVRNDPLGDTFRREIKGAGVTYATAPADEGAATGRCLVLVTPDAQRTMNTFLGISAELSPDDVDPAAVEGSRVTYMEGYLWDPAPAKQAFLRACEISHAAGRKISLSLSDAFCVDRHRDEFRELVANQVDVLFANESEIMSLYESTDFDEAVRSIRGRCAVAALTRGAAGSVVVTAEGAIEIPAAPVGKVVDTTGAGDLYAAGFLYGLTHDLDLEICARLGAIAAAEVICHYGARPETPLRDLAAGVLG